MPAPLALLTLVGGIAVTGATATGVVIAVQDNAKHTDPTTALIDQGVANEGYVPYGSASSAAAPAQSSTPSPSDVPSTAPTSSGP